MAPKAGTCALDNLKTERLSAGYQVDDLARLANVSDNTIKQLEDGGTAELNVCQRIADALAVSLATLGQRVM